MRRNSRGRDPGLLGRLRRHAETPIRGSEDVGEIQQRDIAWALSVNKWALRHTEAEARGKLKQGFAKAVGQVAGEKLDDELYAAVPGGVG